MATFTWQTAAPGNLEAASLFTGVTSDNLTEAPVSNAIFYRSDGVRILLSGTGLSKVLIPETGAWRITGTVTFITVAASPFDAASYWVTIATSQPLADFFEPGAGPANPAYNADILQTILGGADLVADRDNSANILSGFAGDDTLVGRLDGADTLDGGVGTDTADYSSPAGRLYVSLLHGEAVFLDASDLQRDAITNIENVIGGDWGDFLEGDDQDNVLKGGPGDDILVGRAGSDTASYAGGFGGVFVDLSAGEGHWNAAEGDTLLSIENVSGTDYSDVLIGTAGANRLDGRGGQDLLVGGGGADILIGGEHDENVSGARAGYADSDGPVWIDLSRAEGHWSDAEGDQLFFIDDVEGSNFDDVLTGGARRNWLAGAGGDDRLQGGAGADTIDGGGGADTAVYSGEYGGVFVDLAAGRGHWNAAEGDLLTSIENLAGTSYDDWLFGDRGMNAIDGDAGSDTINGGFGADTLSGGAGLDTVSYVGEFGGVWVDLQAGFGRWNSAEGDVISGFETVIGTAYADWLYGSAGDEAISGGDGNDELYGRDGDDSLAGGLGADLMRGGTGVDTLDYSGNFGGVWVDLQTGQGHWNFAEGDSFAEIENVIGGSYDDRLESGTNSNVFTGGAGDDLFVFHSNCGLDRITDFRGNGEEPGDQIRFDTGMFSSFADLMARSSQVGNDVVIQIDATNQLTLENVQLTSMHASDFFLI